MKYLLNQVGQNGRLIPCIFLKIAHEREVKAQVRIQFTDVRKQKVLAIRSLCATQKVGEHFTPIYFISYTFGVLPFDLSKGTTTLSLVPEIMDSMQVYI